MLSVTDTLNIFLVPVTRYKNIGTIQKALLRAAVTGGSQSLAATRLLSLLFDLDLAALLLRSVSYIDFSRPDPTTLSLVAPVQKIVEFMRPYSDVLRLAIDESKAFLPMPTVDILNNYNTEGAPTYQVGVGVLLVLAANLQVS